MQEATEVTLETEVEAGASGYSVTGGGDQGIFVTQVLKDSSAAKLFSLREGDQLLSATIFFDGITYEDALKILQYSEPYKVQFKIRRKLPAREDKEGASGSAQHGLKGSEEQEQDVTDGGSETPTRTLVGDGDQERLISRPREGRRPQRHRLSWPKFQAIQSRRAPGPRRSRSSSEADERRAAPEVSPGSTDTEAQHLAEEREQKAGPGSQQGGRFRNFTFRVSSGKRRSPAGRPGRGTNEGTVQAGVLEEAELPPEPGQHSLPGVGTLGQEAASAPRQTKTDKELEETAGQAKEGVGLAPGEGREGLQGLEGGIARLALRDTADLGARRSQPTELRVQTPTLTTPKFGIAKEKAQETEEGTRALPTGPGRARGPEDTEARREDVRKVDAQETHRQVGQLPLEAGGGKEEDRLQQRQGDGRGEAKDEEGTEGKTKLLKFKLPAFGWSPGKDHKTGEKPQREGEKKKETERQESLKMDMKTGDEEDKAKTDKREDTQGRKTTREKQEAEEIKLELSLGDKEVAARDSKFKMPKFKMPSFGVSAPGKSVEAAVEVSLPKAEADASAPSGQAAVKAGDLSAELPSAELDVKGPELGGKLPEGQLPDAELKEPAAGIALKGHLPKVQMPSIKVPRVDLRAPQVDIKGPKLDLKGAKGEVSAPDVAVSPPSVELEAQAQAQAPGGKLEADVSLGDKEVAARDSKFKMPKFKMPSFGVSAPGKSVEAAAEVSLPKAEADASAPSGQAAVKAGDLSAELPSAELDVKGPELGGKLPEGQLPDAELKEPAAGIALKGHLPKVQMPSIKVPRVDLRAPQVDIKGPKLDLKGAKGEVSAPDVAVSPPSVELEAQAQAQAPGGKLEADVSLGDKEVAARDSKFKMPKFKMPSFGVSAPGKSVEAAAEVSLPKAEADASAPSGQAAVKAGDLSAELPSAELDVKGPELGGKLPEGQLPDAELKEPAAGIALKGHLPKVQMPSIKVPRVDLRAPQVDIKGPKLDLKGAKGEVSAPDVAVSPPSVELEAQAQAQAPGGKLEADVSLGDKEVAARDSKFKMPKFKMPSFGVSAPGKSVEAAAEVSLPKAEADASAPSGQAAVKAGDLSAELPSAELDVKGPELGGKLPEGQLPDAELKEPAAGIALKGHLPKVQMPSIKVPRVDLRAPQVDIKGPKLDLKGAKGEVSAPDVAVSPPSVELEAQAQAQAPGGKLEADVSLGDKEVAARDSKFKMPKFKMPSFGVSAPGKSVEAAAEVSLPKAEADASAPSGQAAVKAGDLSAELPSAELDVKGPELGGKLPEGQLPDAELKEPAAGIALKGHLPKVQMPSIKVPRVDLRAPQVDIKGPKLDLKGAKGEVSAPDVAVSPPSVELEAQAQAQAPGGKLEADVSLGDKEVAARDSKFKMPKFKMPSFGVSAPGKSVEAAAEVSLPKAEADASAPSGQAAVKAGDLSAELPSAELDVKGPELGGKLPEGQLPDAELKEPAAGIALKGHLPKVQMPSIKVPRVDLRAPQVDIKGPKLDLKGAKGEVSAPDVAVSPPSVELEAQAQAQAPGGKLEADVSLGDKEVAARDSKFKMPKFKMPSFGVSAPGKSVEAAAEVSLPKAEADASAPSGQAAVKAGDLSAELPSAELDVKGPELGGKLPEGQLPDAELKEPAAGIALKGHLPKVQMPSIKVPRVDLRAPQVDIKGPKLDLKGAKGEVSAPDVAVSPPSVELEAQAQAQAPGGKLEADVSLGDKEVAARDSKFKMPKFKMPSFGVSAPGKSVEAAAEVSLPKAEADASAPSGQAAVKAGDLSAELPSAELDVKGPELGGKLPEGQLPDAELKEPAAGIALKGHLPKVQMPSIKVPRVDLRAPQVDIKGPKLDLKGAKGEVSAPDVAVSPPSVELEAQAQAQAPGGKLEADVSLGDKEVAARDSKFKMPKFKMPSFGVSAPGKSVEAAAEVSLPKAEADASAPSGQAAVKAGDLSAELPSAELDVKGPELGGKLPEGQLPDAELKEPAAGIALKGHLPKVQMPSIKVPRVDLRAPQVDIKGPKLDLKGAKGEVSAPDVAVSPPSVELEAQAQAQAPGGKLEADVSLGDKEVAARDSKFKMPKFKMPSFGVSAPGKSVEAAAEVSLPKAEADASAPSGQAAVKAGDLSAELPSAELDVKGPELGGKLPEGQLPDAELKEPAAGIALKGHLPKVQMPSIKVPRVDLRAPQVDIKGPKLDLKGAKGEVSAPDVAVSPPSVELEAQAQAQAPGGKLEADVSLGDKEVAARDSKFKMPKFKMPSFGVSAPGKSVEAAAEVSLPKAEADASAPSGQAAVKAGDLSAELPSAELDVKGPELGGKLPEGQLPDAELKEPAAGIALKGHLPKVQMPSIKVPRVDLRAPQVDIKGPKLDLKGAKGEVSAPDVAVSPPSVELEAQAQAQAPGGKLEADVSLGDKEVAARDSKFKMPKFKMPSFGVSAPGKSVEAAAEVSLPKAEADASAPSGQAAVKAGDLSAELPSAELDVKGPELGGKLPEGQLPDAELKEPAAGIALKGHLPKVQMPSIKVPRVDLRAPQVDIKGPKLDLKGAKGEVSAPDVAVSPPSVELEAQAQAQAPGGKLEADVSLGDKEVAARDSKFKMPKFKMPSFGVSAPGKSVEAAAEVSLPKAEADASAPSGQAAVKAGDLSAELPSAELDVKGPELGGKLPEGQLPDAELKEPAAGIALKGHLPKVQMPSIKVPRVDLRAPQVDIKGPKLDLKGAKGEVSAPDVAVSPPSVELEAQAQAQAPGGKLEADVSLGDKEVAARDSKFKMPKFKMPSFGVSAPGKSVEAAAEVSLPKAEADASAPSGQAAVKAGDLSAELPSAELDVKGPELGGKLPEGQLPDAELKEPAAGIALKGHLPKVQMPSIKVPRVDLRAPQVDIKGPKLDLKGAKGEVSAPDVAVSPPSVELEAQAQAQAPGGKLEADVSLGDKEVAARDSKFKMPKFKMPSFGVSAPGKSVEAAAEVSLPKAEADASAPSGQAAVKAGDLSAELPSAELDVKGPELGGKLPEGQLPDAELKEPAAGIALKGHLPKVQMPSIKVPRVDLRAPQVDIKGPKLDLKGAKGEVSAPDVAVSPPSVELEAQAQAQAPGGKLEADVSLGDKEVAARDSKFVVPNFNVSLFASSSTKSSVSSSPFTLDGQHGESVSSSSPSDSLASSFDVHISKDPEADGPPLGPDSDLIPLKKSPFEIPQVFPSPESSSAESSAPDGSAVGPVLPRGGAPFSELSAEGSFKGAVPTRGSPLKVPWLGWPGFSSGRLDLSGTHAEAPSSPGVTLTKYRETLPSVAVLPELPLESSSGSQDARLPEAGGPASLPPLEGGAPSPAQSPAGPVDPLFPASYGRVTFPIFHRPKFAFSIPKAAEAELDPCTVARDLAQSAPSPGWGLDSAAEEAPGLLSPGSQPSRLSVSVPRSGGASEAASGEAPAEDAGREGRGGPLKTQRIQLPSFRRSPEKGAGRAAVPAVTVGAGPTGALPGVCVSPVEMLPEKEGEEGAAPSGCAGLQPTPPSLQASEGAAGLLRGDPAVSLSPAPRGEAGVGGPRTMAAPPEGAGVDPHLPQVQAPRLGSADLALRLGKAKAEVSLSAGSPPQEHRPSAGDGSQGHRPGDVAASRLQPSCGSAHAEAPVVESPEAATTAGSQGGWFRMPALRLPSVRRSAKEKGGAGASAASTARGGEVPAAVKGQGVQVPGSDVEAAVSLRPPETGADEAAAESTLYADVLRRNLDGQGLELHLPPAGVSPADLSTAQVSVRPGDGSLPLQMPGGRLSEARAPTGEMDATPPAGPAGLDLAGGAERAEERPSLPEGPVRLKASRTDRPSQVSVVDMGQPWEGSVLTVKLPRLSVPRFAFPDASSEADVFIPAVTEVSSLDDALGTESAGVWGASILKAGAGAAGGQPVALDLSPEASRISKVRVHIQGAQGEGPEVAVHRRVTAELVDLSGPAAISSQVVRESEIPASEVQRASYGFSLLKGRVPEPPTQVRGQDSWPPEGSPEAPKRAAPGADRLSGDPQPDTGEAFEVVLPGTSVSGQPAITPDVHTEPQGADSGSDEEPAEILEFPPEEDSEEAAACLAEEGRAAQEKPEGKRSSGLFRFWLPNIGFSSSVEETRADPNVDRSAPVQTQPGPRPEAEPPKKQEKGGWFRFPKLGFSSTPTKKSKSSEDTVTPAEQKSQEEAVTFFDARESFSPEDKEEGEVAEAMGTGQGTGAMVTSAARTELILLEQDPDTGDEPAPGPASQGGQT
uniref:PDZ domain-containing protein n=1 Tax=Sus scrofa TaxID=9823 RepID=A0A8D0N798_PIG